MRPTLLTPALPLALTPALALCLALAACDTTVAESEDGGAPGPDAVAARDGAATDGASSSPVDAGGPAPDAATGEPGPDVDRTDPQLHEFMLEPDALDPSVVDSIETQFAQLDTRVAPLGRLVFFLTGATNVPAGWRNHGRLLASYGFHVVIPHYDNRWSSTGTGCSGMPSSCNADTRWEALTGEDTSSVVDIARADSAEGRVVTMLEHLVTAHPGGDWGYYLDGSGGLRHDRILIAGISHGAASAGLYASRRPFWRAVMHSGGWGSPGDAPMTPVSAWYGLAHMGDDQYGGILMTWMRAGMLGIPTSIDGAAAPYDDAHQLVTNATTTYPHCSVCVHSSSPTDGSGAYVFEPAWHTMYGVDALAP